MAIDQEIAVASYSPLGGGLLSGKYASGEEGRLSKDEMYSRRYAPVWMHETARDLSRLAKEHDVHPATLAVAWTARHPGITAPIISARSAEQLAPSLAAAEFRMESSLFEAISALSITPPPATDRIEAVGWFIEHQQVRVMHQGLGQAESLVHPFAESAN